MLSISIAELTYMFQSIFWWRFYFFSVADISPARILWV